MKLHDLLTELEAAMKRLKAAEAAEQAARSDSTQVRNEVNNLQKSIDAEVDKLRGEASWSTDWHNQRERAKQQRVA